MFNHSITIIYCGIFLLCPLRFAAFTNEFPAVNLATDHPDSGMTDRQEQQFQEDLNDFFPKTGSEVDTTGWCMSKINGAWFDYRKMTDTVRIMLSDSSSGIRFSFPFKNFVTSQFGPRNGYWHFGVDIKVARRDSIRCALAGLVRIIQNDRHGYGKVVVVRHHGGLETLYGHLSRVFVSGNDRVSSGQVIGLGGSTGRSTGSHLHFEMRYCGEPFDPNTVIDFDRLELRGDTIMLSRQNFDYLTALRQTVYHIIHKGETLGSLARKYGTTIAKLCVINGITRHTLLRIGMRLVIRKWTDPAPEAAIDEKTTGGRVPEKAETETADKDSGL